MKENLSRAKYNQIIIYLNIMETSYLNRQARAVTKKITADLCKENSEDGIIKIFTFHLNDKNSSNFQKYYSSITTNEQNFLDKEKNFFKTKFIF